MSKQSILVHSASRPKIDVVKPLSEAVRKSGRSAMSIAFEIFWRSYFQKLSTKEYFYFQFYRPEMTRKQKRQYLTNHHRLTRLNKHVGTRTKKHPQAVQSKLEFHKLLSKQTDIRTPDLLAVFAAQDPMIEGVQHLTTASEIEKFLLSSRDTKLFGKPDQSTESVGGFGQRQAHSKTGQIEFTDGTKVSAAELANEIVEHFPTGYLFQNFINNHPKLAEYIGHGSGVSRVNTIKGIGKPARMAQFNCRYATVDTMTPNSHRGTRYSMPIDPKTGKVYRHLVTSLLTDIADIKNQVTGKECVGLDFPYALEMARSAEEIHNLIGDFPILGFDVITDSKGPVFLEANPLPNIDFMQRILEKGLYAPEFSEIFET